MTQNQIAFARLREDIRHNAATEGLSALTLDETKRHNVSSEDVNWYSAKEGARHNIAGENLNWYIGFTTADLNKARADESRANVDLRWDQLDFDKSKFEEQKWKDLWSTWNDSKRVAIAQQEADARIAEWVNRYNLDVDKWVKSEESKTLSETIRNYVNAGSGMVTIISAVAKLLMAALA